MNLTGRVANGRCLVCGSTEAARFLEIVQAPVHCNLLYASRDEALGAARGDIDLAFCTSCGHIYNRAFAPGLMQYDGRYENSLHFSPRFRIYAGELAARLVERYDLHGKDIVEIGCGDGEFLTLLCRLGGNRGLGLDPGYRGRAADETGAGRVTFVRDYYSERYARSRADLICCRHTLEHVYAPAEFLATLRSGRDDSARTAIFFEVPNAPFMMRNLAVWDIIYEHCSYFGSHSLTQLFSRCGFDVHDVWEAFEGQFLCIEAQQGQGVVTSPGGDEDLERLARDVKVFAEGYRSKVEAWRREVHRIGRAGCRAVVWGAGSKGVSFLNTLDVRDGIEYVVDINPRKHGMHVAGTGQRIVAPEFLRDYQPNVVIVMNPIYEGEIRERTTDLGLTVDLLSVWGEMHS